MELPLLSQARANLARARLDRHEIAGSLGDIGTFLPLLVAMASRNGLPFAPSLFFAGLFNIITGLLFSVPMAVQPMKAIAAVAIAQGLSAPQILAAGASVSAVILFLGLTGLMDTVNRVVPEAVVRGIQVALGLTFAWKGLQMVASTRTFLGPDSWLTALVAAGIVLTLARGSRFPAALVLFAGGLAVAVWARPEVAHALRPGMNLPAFVPMHWSDVVTAFPVAALPQIPLTTLNSVVAVCALSNRLFPDRPTNARKVAVSVGLMNLVGTWFGAMPMCHGAGGMAGQYRFGARTNGSILFLGAAKVLLAVLFGASLMALCRAFPSSVLGVMLAFSGLELARSGGHVEGRAHWAMLAFTAGVALTLNSILAGFAAGMAVAALLALLRRGDGRQHVQ